MAHVWVKATISPGLFPSECLVTVGDESAFVHVDQVMHGGKHVRALLLDADGNRGLVEISTQTGALRLVLPIDLWEVELS